MSALLKKVKFDRKGHHVLGTKLGEGAQGAIYSLEKENGQNSDWCAKITAIAKPTKARRSVNEINEGALQYERLMYQSTFVRFQGDIIPRLPNASGDTKYLEAYKYDTDAGFLFIVMEQMQMSLIDAVKLLPVTQGSVDLSAIAERLMYIFKTFHAAYKLITDVKADNFMVAKGEASVAERLRMVDLALLRDLMDSNGKHAENEGVDSLRGTPLYASLNAHELQSPSRRDDIESMLYMLAELIIIVHAEHSEPKPSWYKSGHFLPWSNGTSDGDIFKQKKENLTNDKSELFSRMPSDLATVFKDMWKECRKYNYKDVPNYKFFEKKFKQLVVRLADHKRKAAKRDPDVASPLRKSPRRKTTTRMHLSASDESAGDPMDIDEQWSPENVDPQGSTVSGGLKTDRKYEAATITAIKGPHKGESWVVQEGDQEQYIIGSKPSKANHLKLALSKDKSVAANHARIQLSLSKIKMLIKIWDLSKGKTKINGAVKSSVEFALFGGDTIEIGETLLKVTRATPPS